MVESVFSSLDRPGLSERPYCKTQGLVFHLYAVLLGYGLFKLMEHNPAWRLLLAQLGGMWLVAFPNWGVVINYQNPLHSPASHFSATTNSARMVR